jgi:hypothetical protein
MGPIRIAVLTSGWPKHFDFSRKTKHFHDKGGGADFKTICFKKKQKLPRHNSKRKLQNIA